jgi:hypothetical protein
MGRIESSRRNARAFRLRHSQSFANRRQRFSHAKDLSTSQRFGKTTNPLTPSDRLTDKGRIVRGVKRAEKQRLRCPRKLQGRTKRTKVAIQPSVTATRGASNQPRLRRGHQHTCLIRNGEPASFPLRREVCGPDLREPMRRKYLPEFSAVQSGRVSASRAP